MAFLYKHRIPHAKCIFKEKEASLHADKDDDEQSEDDDTRESAETSTD